MMIFWQNLWRSFAARVAALALVSGMLVVMAVVVLVGTFAKAPTQLKFLLVVSVIIALPLLVGWLTARLVIRPLRGFTQAIADLQANNYKSRMVSSGILEFDQVQQGFKDLAARLHREEVLRKDLISDTSHELNTPLTVMSGQLAAMQEGKLPITHERIGILKEQTDRLTELVVALEAYAKARMPLSVPSEDMNVAAACKKNAAEFEQVLSKHGMQLVMEIPDGLTVRASRTIFSQIISNLLQNAVRYSEATEIRIVANANSLIVSDNGKGIPADSLPYIFERFYRVEPSRNKATGGLGLGLAIVKELVVGQGWSIKARAAEPGIAFIINFVD